MKETIALIFVASALVLAGCSTNHQLVNWEYKIVRDQRAVPGPYISGITEPKVDPKLTELGNQGWELVSFSDSLWIFKRPVK
jgi:hypothetical protein